jgi:hypothetical protein
MDPMFFGETVDPAEASDVRAVLADRVIADPHFARNFVNRYWSYLMGRGLVAPVDDLRATNPPTHPDLLDGPGRRFRKARPRLKHLIRTICNVARLPVASRRNRRQEREGRHFTRISNTSGCRRRCCWMR